MAQPYPVTNSGAPEIALTKATIRAADKLELTNRALGAIIGLSEPTISRMKNGEYMYRRKLKGL